MKLSSIALALATLTGIVDAQPTIINTITHNGVFAGGVGFDPVTNEVIVIDETNRTINFYNRVTGAPGAVIAAPDTLSIGGEVDPSTGNLWVVGESEIVYEITRAGAVLRSWSCAPTITDASALTLDPCDNTIWISNDSVHIVAQFTMSGTATGVQFTPVGSVDGDGIVYDPYSRTFLMGEDTGDQIIVVSRTGAQIRTIPLTGIASPEGLAIDTTTGSVFVGNGFVAPIAVFEMRGIIAPAPVGGVARYGTNCGGQIGISDCVRDDGLTCSGLWIGYQGTLPAGSNAVMHIGLVRQNLPLSFLGSNCTLYATPDIAAIAARTNSNRRIGFNLAVPPGVRGASLKFWACDVDLAGGPGGVLPTASEGIEFVVQ